MNAYDNIVKKLQAGQPLYLVNEFYSTVIRYISGATHYKAKHRGGREYDVERGTDLDCEVFEDHVEITEKEYEEYRPCQVLSQRKAKGQEDF